MKQALIDPTVSVQHIASWTTPTPTTQAQPIYENYPNSARVAEVENTSFPVAAPLFWMQCADDVVADQWYCSTTTSTFSPVVNAPPPENILQTIQGAQTL